MNIQQQFKAWYTSTPVLRFAFGLLRNVRPVAVFGKTVFVTRYDDVADVLTRESDFTVHEIDGYKMEEMGNKFVLGMDASPETTRDRNMLRQVIKREDLAFIKTFINEKAEEILDEACADGKINVANDYARLASVRLVAGYFGVPADEKTMMGWQRAIFNQAFVNLSNDPKIKEIGTIAAHEIAAHLKQLITERKQQTTPLEDNVLNRLINKQADNAWLDDDAVKRNILCILGMVENTSKVVTHVIDQLLRRPDVFDKAKAAAMAYDSDTMRKYCLEALRFNPHNPAILRYCKDGAMVAVGTKHEKKIPAGSTVYAATLGAIFDPKKVSNPKSFDPNRNVEYMHFGHGPHLCTGKYISEVTVPELVANLLRLQNLRRAKGKPGQIQYDQLVFPDSLILEFDA
jgi:cytochrome P450